MKRSAVAAATVWPREVIGCVVMPCPRRGGENLAPMSALPGRLLEVPLACEAPQRGAPLVYAPVDAGVGGPGELGDLGVGVPERLEVEVAPLAWLERGE